MDTIAITDLEVFFQVGTTEAERSQPQRLLISVELEHDFNAAVSRDDLAATIDYFAVSQRLLRFGEGCHWHLIETLAVDIAQMILDEFLPKSVRVQVKKFVIPQAAYVSVSVQRAGK